MSDHENVALNSINAVREADIKRSVENDGTLILSVTCEFVVHHAAREPVTDETLMGLINSQGVCEENVTAFHVIAANNL